jgi:4-hydroxybenzoate polyprenyltransferase
MGILGVAKSAIHEIESFLLFLISAVFFVGYAIVSALEDIRK